MVKSRIGMGKGNEAIGPLSDTAEVQTLIAAHMGSIFDLLGIDWQNDHNMGETPKRFAKSILELTAGRYEAPPDVTSFDNVTAYSQLVVVGPIDVKSLCSHHMLPFVGEAYVGVLPGKDTRLPGLSKYARIVEHFSRRFQIQEELVTQIADFLVSSTKAAGVGVRISASHACAGCRGVNQAKMRLVTTALRDEMLTNSALKGEFLSECDRLRSESSL